MNKFNLKKHVVEQYQDEKKKWGWKIYSSNGDLIIHSIPDFDCQALCEESIKKVLTINNRSMAKYYMDMNGSYKCKIENMSGEVLAITDGYKLKSHCEDAIFNLFYDRSH